jgi:adenine-specific DNA-methyltransferase
MPKNSDWHVLFVLYDLEHNRMAGIIDQGFHIGIGVATGADEIFVRPDNTSDGIEPSRLLPLLRTADLRHNRLQWHGHYVLYPYVKGKLCDLMDYPGLKSYLESHKARLAKRHTAKSSPEKWYKTIDNIKPELVRKPKLILPDFAGNKWLMIDEGHYYPHHNLYYITGPSINMLKILAALLMSDFIREQLFRIGIRMNDGLPRLQAQILKKLRLPIIERLSNNDQTGLIQAYDEQDVIRINRITERFCADYKILSTIHKAS